MAGLASARKSVSGHRSVRPCVAQSASDSKDAGDAKNASISRAEANAVIARVRARHSVRVVRFTIRDTFAALPKEIRDDAAAQRVTRIYAGALDYVRDWVGVLQHVVVESVDEFSMPCRGNPPTKRASLEVEFST